MMQQQLCAGGEDGQWEDAPDEVKHRVWGHNFGASRCFHCNGLLIWDCHLPAGKLTDHGNPG